MLILNFTEIRKRAINVLLNYGFLGENGHYLPRIFQQFSKC